MIFIGIGSAARVGKDSLGKILIEKFAKTGLVAKRFALADPLKDKLDTFVQKEFGFSAFTEITEEKALIRPLLVAFGGAKRAQTKGRYWTQILEEKASRDALCDIAVVTDLRYAELGESDEAFWIKNKGGILIHVTRLGENGKQIPYVNEDEARNDVLVKEMADFKFEWRCFEKYPEELNKTDELFKGISEEIERREIIRVFGNE